jgi:hypothetical protein
MRHMLIYLLAAPVPVVVYPFRHRRDWDGKWITARYKAGLDEIAARYTEWEIIGPPEMHWPVGGSFTPFRDKRPDDSSLLMHPHRANAIDKHERWLVMLFLQRYIIWCARRRDVRPLRGALELLSEVAGARS